MFQDFKNELLAFPFFMFSIFSVQFLDSSLTLPNRQNFNMKCEKSKLGLKNLNRITCQHEKYHCQYVFYGIHTSSAYICKLTKTVNIPKNSC